MTAVIIVILQAIAFYFMYCVLGDSLVSSLLGVIGGLIFSLFWFIKE